jgi:hypothetical protein
MHRLIRHIVAVVVAVFVVAVVAGAHGTAVDTSALQTGDLVFQSSKSGQAPAIKEAQRGHPATHVGIVVRGDDGAVSVLEAVGPVTKTPWRRFFARGGDVAVYRDPRLSPQQRLQLVDVAMHDLGKGYDVAFSADDDRIYCSELVWRAYRGLGLPIGTVEATGDLALDGPNVRRLFSTRWRAHPRCAELKTQAACRDAIAEEPIVTPASLMDDDRLTRVAGTL